MQFRKEESERLAPIQSWDQVGGIFINIIEELAQVLLSHMISLSLALGIPEVDVTSPQLNRYFLETPLFNIIQVLT